MKRKHTKEAKIKGEEINPDMKLLFIITNTKLILKHFYTK